MKRKVGILVGHYGVGTGATFEERDEWALSMLDAQELFAKLNLDGLVEPAIFSIDRRNTHWQIVDRVFGDAGGLSGRNINLRAEWAELVECDLAIELHYNSFSDPGVSGHEVLVNREAGAENGSRRLAREIIDQLSAKFPMHRNRGIKDSGVAILRLLDPSMAAALIEPAFIFEEILARSAWRDEYADALRSAVYRYLKILLKGD